MEFLHIFVSGDFLPFFSLHLIFHFSHFCVVVSFFPIPVCQCYFTMTTHTACDSFHLKHCECVKCNVMYNTCVHKCVSVFDWVSAKDINTFYRWIHELNFRLNRWVLCMCVRTHAICLGINTKLWMFMELQP